MSKISTLGMNSSHKWKLISGLCSYEDVEGTVDLPDFSNTSEFLLSQENSGGKPNGFPSMKNSIIILMSQEDTSNKVIVIFRQLA